MIAGCSALSHILSIRKYPLQNMGRKTAGDSLIARIAKQIVRF